MKRRIRSSRKPTIYLDTNILSVLHYRGGELRSEYWHQRTRNWWELERRRYRLFGSKLTEAELERGVFRGQRQAIAAVRRLSYLPIDRTVKQCAEVLIEERIVPSSQFGDSIHLAIATVHEIDYLLTWNHAHLANVDTQRHLNVVARGRGWRPPLLVSPETIPQSSLGQVIDRPDDEITT